MYEKFPISYIRSKSLDLVYDHIRAEDENTDYAALGPVNKVMNMIAVWLQEGKDSPAFKRHLERNLDFMWMGPDGIRMNGTNGSQLWDTAFTCQALIESGRMNKKVDIKSILSPPLLLERSCRRARV